MDIQLIIPIVTSVLAAITAISTVVVGARLQKSNEINARLRDSLSKKKERFYKEILAILDGLIDGEYDRDDGDYTEIRDVIAGKFKEAAYYASPEVIKSFGDLMQHYYTNEDADLHVLRARKLFAELTVQIRKDLGHTSSFRRKETWLDVMRFSIRDISKYIPKKTGDRGVKTGTPMIYEGKKIV